MVLPEVSDLYAKDEAMNEALMEIMKKDIDKKVEQGMQQGMQNAKLTGIRNLLQMTAQQAMNALGIDPAQQASYLSLL